MLHFWRHDNQTNFSVVRVLETQLTRDLPFAFLVALTDPSRPVDERNKLIIGIFLLVMEIALAFAGILYYMMRFKGQ